MCEEGPVSELSLPVPWGEIRGKVWGPDHGRPVLCLHGWADNCGSFNTLIPFCPKDISWKDLYHLVISADNYRYVAVDLAGHGLSSHRPPGVFYSFTEYVADVRRVVDALQLKKFSIIGHSMGAEIAALFSALYPEMVDALVLLDSFGLLPTDSKDICKVMRQGFEEMVQYEKKTEEKKRVYTYKKAVERLLAANPSLSEQAVNTLLERGLVQVEGGFAFSRDLRVNFKNILRISLEQSLEMQSRIRAAVLVVLAEDGFDKLLSEAAQSKFTSTLLQRLKEGNHTVVMVPGDHHAHLNKPEVVAPFVSDFLQTKVLSQPTNRGHKCIALTEDCLTGVPEGITAQKSRVLSPGLFRGPVSELSLPVPWGEIRGKVWGPDHGRPVLCLHGWADNCGSFNTLIPLLPKECRYVAVDLAGHGLSSHRPPGVFYSFHAYVADVRRIVDGLQWTKLSIIGHSMGGNIAAMFSSLFPEMVEAIVLLDTFGFLPTDLKEIPKVMSQGMDEMLQYEKKTEEKKRVYTYEKAAERLLAANPTLSEQSVNTLLERGLVQVEGGFAFSRDLRLNFKNIARISLEQSLEMQSRIQASVLVVLADAGFAVSVPESLYQKFSSTLLQGFRDRNHTVVTAAGDHHVHLNNPEVVAQFVSDFLQTKVLSQQLPV